MTAAGDPLANEGGLSGFKPILAAIATICLAVLGCFLASSVGSISYGGPGAIVGGVGGFFVFGGLACCLTGFLKEVLSWYLPKFSMHSFVPSAAAFAVGKHGSFDLIVTIHKLENLRVLGRLVGAGDLYVTATVGDNPPKSTCVKQNKVWDEQFRLRITPSDDTVLIRVLDQDFFGSTALGYVAIEISHILKEQFPEKKPYHLTLKQGKAGAGNDGEKAHIVLSFAPAQGFPVAAKNDMGGEWEEQYGHREDESKTQMGNFLIKQGDKRPGYGALTSQFSRIERFPEP